MRGPAQRVPGARVRPAGAAFVSVYYTDLASGGWPSVDDHAGEPTGVVVLPLLGPGEVAALGFTTATPQPEALALPDGGYGIGVRLQGLLALSWDQQLLGDADARAFLTRVARTLRGGTSAG